MVDPALFHPQGASVGVTPELVVLLILELSYTLLYLALDLSIPGQTHGTLCLGLYDPIL